MKLVDAGDSKSPAARRAGSSPAPGTTVNKAGSFHELSAFLLGQLLWRRHVISAHSSPAHPAIAMTAQDLIAHATVLAYRLAGYALQNMAEDAALLAMMFC